MHQVALWGSLVGICLNAQAAFGNLPGPADPPLKSSALANESPAEPPASAAKAEADAPSAADNSPADKAPAATSELTEPEVLALIEQLGADDYRQRQRATARLKKTPRQHVRLLVKATESADLETLTRIFLVLRDLYVQEAPIGLATAEMLENLAETQHPESATAARSILRQNAELREQRALDEILRMGGKIKYLNPYGVGTVSFVILVPEWNGGDQGLQHLKRLQSLDALYVIHGTEVSEEAVNALVDVHPRLRIQYRGAAYLGIRSDQLPVVGMGCVITGVEPNSAAQRGGILVHDIIRSFNGKPIANFDQLIEQIKTKKGGDEVVVEVERNGVRLPLKIELGTWAGITEAEKSGSNPPLPSRPGSGLPPIRPSPP